MSEDWLPDHRRYRRYHEGYTPMNTRTNARAACTRPGRPCSLQASLPRRPGAAAALRHSRRASAQHHHPLCASRNRNHARRTQPMRFCPFPTTTCASPCLANSCLRIPFSAQSRPSHVLFPPHPKPPRREGRPHHRRQQRHRCCDSHCGTSVSLASCPGSLEPSPLARLSPHE